jgi:hypothetical protein
MPYRSKKPEPLAACRLNTVAQMPSHPTVFISYSWDDEAHKEWVRQLATQLRADGVDARLDHWHAVPGDQLPEFMEREIRGSDYNTSSSFARRATKRNQKAVSAVSATMGA